jgi:hypothetical protein
VPTDYQEFVDETFATHMLHRLNVRVSRLDGVFYLDGVNTQVQLSIHEVGNRQGSSTALVYLDMSLGQGKILRELMMGIGKSPPEAISNAVRDLIETVLCPILGLLTRLEVPDVGNTGGLFVSGDTEWGFMSGRILNNNGDLVKRFEDRSMLSFINDALALHLKDDSRVHWVKFLYTQFPGKVIPEVRIDNQIDEAATHEWLSKAQIPPLQATVMFRQFTVLIPVRKVVSPQ